MWKDWFMPNADYLNSDQFGKGNGFSSGNVAMTWSFTWYTCCFDMKKLKWDLAVPPTVNGKLTAGGDIDNFAILKQSKNQDAAFKVLTKMALDKDLPKIFGSLPGKAADRPDWYAAMQTRADPNKIDWTVADAMLQYPDIPNHEAWVPNQTKATDVFAKFGTLMAGTPDLNLDSEIAKVQSQLDALFK
jgi:spermidine/putrescine-binding protein